MNIAEIIDKKFKEIHNMQTDVLNSIEENDRSLYSMYINGIFNKMSIIETQMVLLNKAIKEENL